MNRIVREHYPASRLPAELREGLPPDAQVRVSVTVQPPRETRESLRAELDRLRGGMADFRNADEINATVRRIRDGGALE
ncbi:MAG: hypothetical protein ACRC7G_03390 [Beijerinckiaceae bacterium]